MSMSIEEHDYIGLSEASKMESSEKSTSSSNNNNNNNNNNNKGGLNLKATELRLGLPGSESPERDSLVKNNNLVSGAKRVFSDTINGGSGKWVFNVNGGSEVELCKNGGLFSPKGDTKNSVLGSKDCVLASTQDLMEKKSQVSAQNGQGPAAAAPATKAQVVGWPPIRSFRKNTMATNPPKNENVGWPPIRSFRKNAINSNPSNTDNDVDAKLGSSSCLYVKVSMDGAPYLRKVDLKIYTTYMDLSSALEKMFSCFTIGQCSSPGTPTREGLSENRLVDLLHGSEYVLTYEDKDGDWMLVGDVPWDMFTGTCKRMRIMKSSEAKGLAPRAMEKCRNQN